MYFSCIAPDMKIYCFYGVGNPTERSYFYAVTDENLSAEGLNETDNTAEHKSSSPNSSAKEFRPSLVSGDTCNRTKKKGTFRQLHSLYSILMQL